MEETRTDSELLREVKKGSSEAFEALFYRHRSKILNYLYSYTGRFDAAQDIAQEVFVKAYKKIGGMQDTEHFSSWLYKVAVNMAKSYFRKAASLKEESLDRDLGYPGAGVLSDIIGDPKNELAKNAEKEDSSFRIQQALNKLPDIYTEVLVLCDVQGLSYADAASVLDCKTGTIGSRLSEARRKFKDIYIRLGGAI